MPVTHVKSQIVDVFEFQKKMFTFFGFNFWTKSQKLIPYLYSRFMIITAFIFNFLALTNLLIKCTVSVDAVLDHVFLASPHVLGIMRYIFFMYYNKNFYSFHKFFNNQCFRNDDEVAQNIRKSQIKHNRQVFGTMIIFAFGTNLFWWTTPKSNSLNGRFEYLIPETIYIPKYLKDNFFVITYILTCFAIFVCANLVAIGSSYMCNYIMYFKAEFQVCAHAFGEIMNEIDDKVDNRNQKITNFSNNLNFNITRHIDLLHQVNLLKKTLKQPLFLHLIFSEAVLAVAVVKIIRVKKSYFA